MPKLDIPAIPVRTGSIYPPHLQAEVAGRTSLRLGDAGGLTQFGANLVTLEPGAKSSIRHWHENEDEFVYVTEGTLTLIEDGGPVEMRPGDAAAFPAGNPDGHHIVNLSDKPGTFLVVGTRAEREVAHYSDLDLKVTIEARQARFTRRDGSPLDPEPDAEPEPEPA